MSEILKFDFYYARLFVHEKGWFKSSTLVIWFFYNKHKDVLTLLCTVTQNQYFPHPTKRRNLELPTMHCFQWNILNRLSCASLVMKHTSNYRIWWVCLEEICFITNDPHGTKYKIFHWKHCIVVSSRYLLFIQLIPLDHVTSSKLLPFVNYAICNCV